MLNSQSSKSAVVRKLTAFKRAIREGPLGETNFLKYFTGFTLSNFGDSIALLAITFAVLEIEGSASDLGLVLLAGRLPVVVFVVFAGVLGDRLPRRKVMVVADVTRAITQATLAFLLLTSGAQLWQLMALQAVAGTATAFFGPASTGLVAEVARENQLQKSNALLSLSRSLSSMLALAVSATFVAFLGTGYAIAIDALTFVASACLLGGIKLKTDSLILSRSSYIHQLKEGYSYLRSNAWLMVLVVHAGLVNGMVIAPIMVLGPAIANSHLAGALSWAAIGIAITCGAIAGATLAIRFQPPRLLATGIAVVLLAIPMCVMLALGSPIYYLLLGAFFFGAQSSIYMTSVQTVMQKHVPREMIARISAYVSLGSLVFMPAGLAVAGIASDRLGSSNVLWFTSVWIVITTLVAIAFPQVRRLVSNTKKD